MLTSEIRVDVNNHTAPDIYARVGESNTRRVKFSPGYYDTDGNFVGLSTEEDSIRVQFRMVKPDNTFVVVDLPISIVEDPITFRVMLTPEMCQVAGSGYYDIRIGDSEDSDEFLYTASGRFVIDDNMLTDEMIESIAAVNGLIFPDDFLTSADLEDYATEEYVDTSIVEALEGYATESYVNNIISYSTEEKVVGTWYDGKPLYAKLFTGTTAANFNTASIIADVGEGNTVRLFDGLINGQRALNGNLDNTNNKTYTWVVSDLRRIANYSFGDHASKPCYCIVHYTKNSD